MSIVLYLKLESQQFKRRDRCSPNIYRRRENCKFAGTEKEEMKRTWEDTDKYLVMIKQGVETLRW